MPWIVSEENRGSTAWGTYGDMKDIDDEAARIEAKSKKIMSGSY